MHLGWIFSAIFTENSETICNNLHYAHSRCQFKENQNILHQVSSKQFTPEPRLEDFTFQYEVLLELKQFNLETKFKKPFLYCVLGFSFKSVSLTHE